MTSELTIDRLRKLYKGYQNPGMAVPAPSEYERGFNQALDLAIGIVMTAERSSEYRVIEE